MKKRWTAALLALVLAVLLLPGTAFAADGDGPAGSRLIGVDLAVYRVLKAEVAKIANGSSPNTTINIPDQPGLSWTLSALGGVEDGGGAAIDRLRGKLLDALHMERVYTALVLDCPYETFWRGLQYTYTCEYAIQGGRGYIRNLSISFRTSQAYQGGGEYSVNPAKVATAKEAEKTARAIVDRHKGESDYEKLVSYCREICQLTSFNSVAARGGVPYGDPWQLVYVFDGDPDTNVVCEGYSKAFQYLCNLSDFRGDVACYTVTGTMNGGGHMWNVVRMEDGGYYLVDVTNCDGNAVGAPDRLFLVGGSSSNGGRIHTVSTGRSSITYIYEEEQENLYADGYLTLSAGRYVYDPSTAQPAAAFTDVPEWCAKEAAWAAQEGITKGYGGSTTFAPGRDCSQVEILTFLWRAEDEPLASAKAPITVASYYQDAVNWAYEEGFIDDAFEPDAPCTRAQAVSYIWQALGELEAGSAASFSDVAADAPYAGAVSWAVEKKVTNGRGGNDTFAPDLTCSRGEIACFLYRAYH